MIFNNTSEVTGVKGNSENNYRKGNINLTPDNIGAKPLRRCAVGQSDGNTSKAWFRFASCELNVANSDTSITFKVSTGFSDDSKNVGILTAHIRNDATKDFGNAQLVWEYAGEFINPNDFVLAYKSTPNVSLKVELWVKITTGWQFRFFEVLSEHSRASFYSVWKIYDVSSSGYSDYITAGYTQIPSTLLTLKNNIESVVNGIQYGTAKFTDGKCTVVFPKTFTNIPVVVAVPVGSSENNVTAIKVINITTSSCEFTGTYIGSSGDVSLTTTNFNWIAIGL